MRYSDTPHRSALFRLVSEQFKEYEGNGGGYTEMRKLCRKYRQGIQNRQCVYNLTLRRVRITILAVQKQKLLHTFNICGSVHHAL